jgi:NADPH-dependent curcumin reductase CurA
LIDAADESVNRKIVLLSHPEGTPEEGNFGLETAAVDAPGPGEILVRTHYLSIDAWIGTTLTPGWLHGAIPLGATVPATGVGEVIASNCDGFREGQAVTGRWGAQSHARMAGDRCELIDVDLAPMRAYVGLLNASTGLTAWFGMREVGQVQPGDTVVVSAAAGAVGSVAGQVAKIGGARVIGIAGGAAKCRVLTSEIGFDEAIDYKGEDVDARLKALAPDGVNVFFDNVGGEMLDTVLDHIADRARVVICGAISQYDDHDNVYGPTAYLRLAERNARMEGFTIFRFIEHWPEARKTLAEWLATGRIMLPEQVEVGLEAFPRALNMLFTGGNTGKLMVQV